MNKNDFKNPLIQSGAILLAVFLLISIVAGSGSKGLWGSIGALISGLFYAVIYIIALVVAIVFSIAVLVGIYLAAVWFYDKEKGRNFYEQLKYSLCVYYRKIRGIDEPVPEPPQAATEPEPQPQHPAVEPEPQPSPAISEPEPATQAQPAAEPVRVENPAADQFSKLESRLNDLAAQINYFSKSAAANADKITLLEQRVEDLASGASSETETAAADHTHQQLSDQIIEIRTMIEKDSGAVQNLEQQLGQEIGALKDGLAALNEKTSVPEVVSGILSYIDKVEDRDLITEKAKEAISRGMTYAQIDEFFQSSLSPEVYKELAAHPRLTKDFLRSIKKKF